MVSKVILSDKNFIRYSDFFLGFKIVAYILQEENGFPQLESLCFACGSLAGVHRSDRLLYRFVTAVYSDSGDLK